MLKAVPLTYEFLSRPFPSHFQFQLCCVLPPLFSLGCWQLHGEVIPVRCPEIFSFLETTSIRASVSKTARNCWLYSRPSRVPVVSRWRAGGAQPSIWNLCPLFHVWPPGCCIHPILYLKNVAPLLVFGLPAGNLGDGPGFSDPLRQTWRNGLLKQLYEPISGWKSPIQKVTLFSDTECKVVQPWAQFGGGHGGRVLPLFQVGI